MNRLSQLIHIKAAYTRSINLSRDCETLELICAYLPTTRAVQGLSQIAEGLTAAPSNRALALVGPYGSGKSAFALFLGALLSPQPDTFRQTAMDILRKENPALARRFAQALGERPGFLRVQVNGIPDSLVRQLMTALAKAVGQQLPGHELATEIREAAQPGTAMDKLLSLFRRVQSAWADAGGCGVLVEIDELGKFLEYESYHPQHREMHLLQLLAEHAHSANRAPLHLVVLLHQAFEHYAQRLGKALRDEWQKIQGRFATLAFLEPAEQSLRIIAAAFERQNSLSDRVQDELTDWTNLLAREGALPASLETQQAKQIFQRCYPLHPLSLLVLPILCQKVAQNERTLFSYLGSGEPLGLRERLDTMQMGDWIMPWQLYDYFMLNPSGGFADPLTYHRWAEVAAALSRLDCPPDAPAIQLLKTIGLLNLTGAQRGLKASHALLHALFGTATDGLLAELERASVVHLRQFSQEYRVWQGSDFDLTGAVRQTSGEYAQGNLADTLNTLAPIKPVVARRATIETGCLRSFTPAFTDAAHWPPKAADGLNLWFYLAETTEQPALNEFPPGAVVAVCHFTERLREAVAEWMALQDLPKRYAILAQDPVAQREHQAWLASADREARQWIRALLGEPEALTWHWGGKAQAVQNRRELQQRLSDWADHLYAKSPQFRNELINRDFPSPSANTGRKRLLAAMITAADRPALGIDKTPAEKSLYLSILQDSKLHRKHNRLIGFYPPEASDDPCRVYPAWQAITDLLGDHGERQVSLNELYANLAKPPFGIKLGVLPVLTVAYLLAHRREVAVYQEGAFCESLSVEQAELLCRRPDLFALERFDLGGLRGDLFDRYMNSVVGKVRHDATLLDIVRPLAKFMRELPEYTQHCTNLSPPSRQVRDALRQAVSPGVLLFDALPQACGIEPTEFARGNAAMVESLVQRLVACLRELHQAYPKLLDQWQSELNQALLDGAMPGLADLRQALAQRYQGLERYTPDRMGVGALARRLADPAHQEDRAWLESVATLLGRQPPTKWRDDTYWQATLRLRDMAGQLRDLEALRLALDKDGAEGAVLLKIVDVEGGETSRAVQLTTAQQMKASAKAHAMAKQMAGLDETEKLAVIASLFRQMTRDSQP